MSNQPKTGKRIQVYLAADLVERWEQTPRYERSAEVAKALRAWWKMTSESRVSTHLDEQSPPAAADVAPSTAS